MPRHCMNLAWTIGTIVLLCAPAAAGCVAESEPAEEPFEEAGAGSFALTREEFSAAHCFPGITFCGVELSGGRVIRSDGRVKAVDGHVDVLSGSVRVRIFRARQVGGDELLSTYNVGAGKLVRIGAAVPGIKRRMRAVVDQADGARYNIAVNFTD